MQARRTVLLLGATGRTGGRVLAQLLARGVAVRALVRSAARLPPAVAGNPRLAVVEAELLALGEEELQRHLRGCDAVVSCLGHVISFRGVYGRPRDLVAASVARVCRAIRSLRPEVPVRFVLMSSVSVNRPAGQDTRRGMGERAFLCVLRALLPPARDNQLAADFLWEQVGESDPHVQWTIVRPDALLEGEVTEYALHEGLVNSLSAAGSSNMANVAHFMCELVLDDEAWERWRGKAPVLVNAAKPATEVGKP